MVFNQGIGNGAAMVGLSVDNLVQNVWMHSNKKIFYIEYSQENRNIWIDYLKINKYKDALKLCKDSKYQPLISGLVGDQIFNAGNYDKSAEFYAKSNKSFEEVSLKFLNTGLHQHLCKYLELFLKRIKLLGVANPQKDYKPQVILLSTWIIELKLNEINKIKIKIESEDKDQITVENQKLFLAEEEKNFWNFVSQNFKDKSEIEAILQNHGKIDECMQSPKGKFIISNL